MITKDKINPPGESHMLQQLKDWLTEKEGFEKKKKKNEIRNWGDDINTSI